jgi:hypothetical protein
LPGIRTLDVQVPLATYTGWAVRRAPFAANEDCALTGQYVPFATTQAERIAKGDPRPSIEERYPSFGEYYSRTIRAINNLVKDRYMLCEDSADEQARILEAGLQRGVPAPKGKLPAHETPPLCHSADAGNK